MRVMTALTACACALLVVSTHNFFLRRQNLFLETIDRLLVGLGLGLFVTPLPSAISITLVILTLTPLFLTTLVIQEIDFGFGAVDLHAG